MKFETLQIVMWMIAVGVFVFYGYHYSKPNKAKKSQGRKPAHIDRR